MKYQSAIESDQLLLYATTWINQGMSKAGNQQRGQLKRDMGKL